MKIVTIGKNEAGQRLDKYLKKYLNQAGSGFIYKMLRKKNILLNDKKSDGSPILAEGDSITFYLADETLGKFHQPETHLTLPVETITIDVVYEDDNYLIVNKPAGILSQKSREEDISMVEQVTGYLLQQGAIQRKDLDTFHPAVCNRLDRNTSGLILAGKTLRGLQDFSALLKSRAIHKYYLALVKGVMKKPQTRQAWLIKDSKSNQVRILSKPDPRASYVETYFEPLGDNGEETLLKIELLTGKTHQIRSHLASLGYPLAGDRKYGDPSYNRLIQKRSGLDRQFLHAWQIVFPLRETVPDALRGRTFTASLPQDLAKTLECTANLDKGVI